MIKVLFFHSQGWVAEFFARLSCSEEIEAYAASKVHQAKTLICARNIKYLLILPGTIDPELRFLETPWWYYRIISVSEEMLLGAVESGALMEQLLRKICR